MANAIQQDNSVHAAVLDFSKAFDKFPHKRLLKKLDYYRIHGTLLTWFEYFLTGRHQTVICEGGHLKLPPLPLGSYREQFWDLYYY